MGWQVLPRSSWQSLEGLCCPCLRPCHEVALRLGDVENGIVSRQVKHEPMWSCATCLAGQVYHHV